MKRQINEFNLIQSAISYLRDELGFKLIDYEVPFSIGQMKYTADIVIYKTVNDHEIPYIVVEVKAGKKFEKYAWIQAESYAKKLNTPYFAVTNGEEWLWFKTGKFGESQTIDITQIDFKGSNIDNKRFIKNYNQFLKILNHMKEVIYNYEKLRSDAVLYELIKILFIKIECEKDPRYEDILINQNIEESNRIKGLYQEKILNYPKLHESHLSETFFRINLNNETIYELINILKPYKFIDSKYVGCLYFDFPIFGHEYGKKSSGNYYIPSTLSQFLVNFLNPKIDDFILDPACNNGTILIEVIKKKCKQLKSLEIPENVKDNALHNINGMEVDPELYWLTCMNLLIRGCDINGISILEVENTEEENIYDKIYCFPPFSPFVPIIHLDQLNILEEYNLRLRYIEEYFLVKSIKLLKKSGKMCIVLPDRFLTSHNSKSLRKYLKEKTNILAIISLPKKRFFNTAIKTSVLFLEKKDGFSHQGPVFMAKFNSKFFTKEKSCYDVILDDYLFFKEKKLESGEISADSYAVKGNLILENDIIDPSYYEPKYLEIMDQLKKLKKYAKLEDVAEKITIGNKFKPNQNISENCVPLIKIKNIIDGKIIENDLNFVEKNHFKNYLWPPGTIIISKIGEKNKISILPSNFPEYAIDGNLIGIKLNKDVLPEYLASFLNSKYGKIQLDMIRVSGIIPYINISHLKDLIIPLHTIEVQKRILDLKDRIGDNVFLEEVE